MDRPLPTIVVVDDSAEVRSLAATRLTLSKRVTVVGQGANGMEAIGLAYLHKPTLLLLDLSMPAMDGLDALAGIISVSPDTRIVVYSGFEERGIAAAARELGAAGFVEKSTPIDRLADEVLAVLPGQPGAQERQPRRRRGPLSLVSRGTQSNLPTGNEDDQRKLDEHLESFREVFDEAAIGMATMTLAGTVVRANRSLGALMRCDPSSLVGVDYGRLTSGRGDQLDAALDDITKGVSDLAVMEHDVSGWPELRRVRASLAAVRDSTGQALYAFLQVQDITAQAAAEEELRRSEERLRLLVEAVQEYAIFMLDTDGRVASWNAGAQRIKGYAAHEILGSHFRVFYPTAQQTSGHPEDELAIALREGHYREEGWRIRKDGTQFWANVLITAVFDDSGSHIGYAKVTRDATERRRSEQELNASYAAVASANKELESLAARLGRAVDDQSKFLAMTAHELRSPLMVLGGSAQTLMTHWAELLGAERIALLNGMFTSADRLQRLLDDLLAASRLDANTMDVRMAPVRVADVLSSVVDAVRASDFAADISVSASSDLRVVADQDRLAQAVDNLVRNALSHGMPPVSVTAEAAGSEMAQIQVSDSGRGVHPSVLPRLFEKFATGDRVDGTGLGLYIARELAKAQGGDAFYERQSEQHPAGSFIISLPLAQ